MCGNRRRFPVDHVTVRRRSEQAIDGRRVSTPSERSGLAGHSVTINPSSIESKPHQSRLPDGFYNIVSREEHCQRGLLLTEDPVGRKLFVLCGNMGEIDYRLLPLSSY